MENKKAKWLAEYDAGILDSSKWPRLNYTKCVNGKAEAVKGDPNHTFKCKNVDLYDFINHATLGSSNGYPDTGIYPFLTGSGSWGWVDPESGREFVASGMYDGTAFLEILPEGRFAQLGFLPCPAKTNPNALWKELRGYKNYMLIGSELSGHGVQIFDMKKLLSIPKGSAVVTFDIVKDVTGHFMDLPDAASHNVVVSEEREYGVAVGSRPRMAGSCKGGLIFFDLKDPSKPKKLGCNPDDGYVHDAQCLVYRGPHTKYVGRDICYGYNEDSLTIYDVTDKANSTIISITSYEGATYTHQGWVLDPNNQEYLVMDDEIDEIDSAGPAADKYAVTYIWDIKDLEHPKQTGLYKSE
jgi:choice-of-anchor B domain-containing protein